MSQASATPNPAEISDSLQALLLNFKDLIFLPIVESSKLTRDNSKLYISHNQDGWLEIKLLGIDEPNTSFRIVEVGVQSTHMGNVKYFGPTSFKFKPTDLFKGSAVVILRLMLQPDNRIIEHTIHLNVDNAHFANMKAAAWRAATPPPTTLSPSPKPAGTAALRSVTPRSSSLQSAEVKLTRAISPRPSSGLSGANSKSITPSPGALYATRTLSPANDKDEDAELAALDATAKLQEQTNEELGELYLRAAGSPELKYADGKNLIATHSPMAKAIIMLCRIKQQIDSTGKNYLTSTSFMQDVQSFIKLYNEQEEEIDFFFAEASPILEIAAIYNPTVKGLLGDIRIAKARDAATRTKNAEARQKESSATRAPRPWPISANDVPKITVRPSPNISKS